ncbi:hypothetical protein HK098_001587 [Nowakowskiella sp. JEL0407]|nr:hypothetical protein HK098_001587 [Nowakowskiella sp. JEL0407]
MKPRPEPRLIVIDLDGTLLPSKSSTPTPRTIAVLQRLRTLHEIKIIYASGRSIRSIEKVCRLSSFTPDYYIAYNGAVVYNPVTKQKIKVECMSVDSAASIIEEMMDMGDMGFAAEVAVNDAKESTNSEEEKQETKFYTDEVFYDMRKDFFYYPVEKFESPLSMLNCIREYDLQNFDEAVEEQIHGITKLLIVNKSLGSSELFKKVPAKFFEKESPVTVVYSNSFQLEVSKHGVCKGKMLQWTCENLLTIDKDHIIAFGDMLNDIEMLQYAGIGVAMGNASEDVKSVADRVTLSNNEDGVAVELEKILAHLDI